MYGRIFESIFDSSIMEEGVHVRYLWHCLLVLCNQDGVVDLTREALARRVNIPLTQVNEALENLMAPDPSSRSPLEDGRRLVPIRETNWGWRVVNFEGYRGVRNPTDRKTYMREYMRGRRAAVNTSKQDVSGCKQLSTVLAPAAAATDTSTDTEAKEEKAPPATPDVAPPRLPAQEGSKAKNAALPEIPAELDTPEFRTAWGKRLVERKEKGAKGKLTPSQVAGQFEQLIKVAAKHGISVAVDCVDKARSAGWQGIVFEDSLPGAKGSNGNGAYGVTSGVLLAQRRELGRSPELDAQIEEDRRSLMANRAEEDRRRATVS